MATKRLKRPRDPVQLAKLIGDIATGQLTEEKETEQQIAAKAHARNSGAAGGKKRAELLPKARRTEIAKQAAAIRWGKVHQK